MSEDLTHIGADGAAHMVDVGDKPATTREAVAESRVTMLPATLDAILAGDMKKGDVLGVARIAGIMAAKETSRLLPLCHPIALSKVTVELEPSTDPAAITIRAAAACIGPTGVEMEALTAASVAALTVYDMAKALDRGMTIGPTRLLAKQGGRSGSWSVEDT